MTDLACPHAGAAPGGRFCAHLVADQDASYRVRFTGRGTEHHLVCAACAGAPDDALAAVCAACFRDRQWSSFDVDGIVGAPEVRVRPSALRFEHREHTLPALGAVTLRALAPLEDQPRPSWIALTGAGDLLRIDLDDGAVTRVAALAGVPLDLEQPLVARASPCGRHAAVVNSRGRRGVVVDLASGAVTMQLDRGEYHEEHCEFSVAFFRDGGETRLVHATDWNRLDISDPATGRLLTARDTEWRSREGAPEPPHYLDYFHCGLTVSPDGVWLVDDGWVWAPVGVLRSLDLRRFARDNVWESEDGPSVKALRQVGYFWDGPRCFVADRTLAAWGFGGDDEHLVNAALLYDVERGELLRWFAGPPRGAFVFDEHLFVSAEGHGTSAWDVATGERLLHAPGLAPAGYHRGARHFLTPLGGGALRVSCLAGEG